MFSDKFSNIVSTTSRHRESVDTSSITINYERLIENLHINNAILKNLSSTKKQDNQHSNTLSLSDYPTLQERNKKEIEARVTNDFESFKDKFENFLRFEDIPIEYVSPIEKEFITFLKAHKIQTMNLVAQWIIDAYDDPKTLLNIVKILGNVAAEFMDTNFVINLCILVSHQDTEVKEYVLRIQEKVMSDTFHKFLSHAQLAPQWIDEYRIELIEMYNEENCGA